MWMTDDEGEVDSNQVNRVCFNGMELILDFYQCPSIHHPNDMVGYVFDCVFENILPAILRANKGECQSHLNWVINLLICDNREVQEGIKSDICTLIN